jgi:hypothetical protein
MMKSILSLSGIDIWTEVNSRHVHQDLIESYKGGQAWQFSKGNGFKNVVDSDDNWTEPSWIKYYTYRLHPHNEFIQAHKNGAKIQYYAHGEWIEEVYPAWYEGIQYRIKPDTKIVYEWMSKQHLDGAWVTTSLLMSEEEAKRHFVGYEYKKAGRYWEVEV